MYLVVFYALTLLTFKERFVNVCNDIFAFGLKESTKRKEEVDSFFSCMEEALTENKRIGVSYIQEYIDFKKKVHFIYIFL